MVCAAVLALGACAAAPRPIASGVHAPVDMRVVSYNVGMGFMVTEPSPRLRRMSRRAYSIRAALVRHPELRGFDVLGLQEVCGPSVSDQLDRLGSVGALNIHFARADLARDGACRKGQAILTRHPILARGVIRLPPVRRVGRAAIWADIAVPVGSGERLMRVYNLHLDNRSAHLEPAHARWLQMRPVLAHIKLWRATHPEGGVVLLGDFNNLEADRERTIEEVSKELTSVSRDFESTHVLVFHTDWIFFGGLTLVRSTVPDVVLSDHYPVVADFSWPGLATQAQKGIGQEGLD